MIVCFANTEFSKEFNIMAFAIDHDEKLISVPNIDEKRVPCTHFHPWKLRCLQNDPDFVSEPTPLSTKLPPVYKIMHGFASRLILFRENTAILPYYIKVELDHETKTFAERPKEGWNGSGAFSKISIHMVHNISYNTN